INLLSSLQAVPRTKLELAREAIDVEQNLLAENVGVQDQLHAAFGGLNRFDFESGANFTMRPIDISGAELRLLTNWMVLVFTGTQRRATDVLADQLQNMVARKIDKELSLLLDLVESSHYVLEHERGTKLPIALGRLLHDGWMIKRRLSSNIS